MDEVSTALDRVLKQARIQLETVRASYANRATSADMKDIENIIRATSLRTTEQCKAINDKLDILKEQWGVERGTGNAGSTGNPGNTGSTQWYASPNTTSITTPNDESDHDNDDMHFSRPLFMIQAI